MTRLHASGVALADPARADAWAGVLLLGASGSGKSDLALRLIDAGGRLIADDQVLISAGSDGPQARAPDAIRGLIELRGLGLVRLEALDDVCVRLACEPAAATADRLPEPRTIELAGTPVPLVALDYAAAGAAARIRCALRAVRLGLFAD